MSGYKVIDNSKILEKNTGSIIYHSGNRDEIYNICRKLNFGSGFQGWTPDFFTITEKER